MLPASLAAKWLPRDFVEATRIGGAFTVMAYLVMLVLFIVQVVDFMTKSTLSSLLLDFHEGPQLQINFDIDMYDIECRNMEVVIIDEMRSDKVRPLAQEIKASTLDNKGRHKGHHSIMGLKDDDDEDEWSRHETKQRELEKADGKGELDSDWASSHDGFKHKSFEHVVQFHDFALINFFAEWCSHCRNFAPKWNQIAEKVNAREFYDAEKGERTEAHKLKVTALKMNCVDFKDLCRKQGIDAFPTIRLYKSDGTFSVFEGERNEGSILRWIETVVRAKAYGFKKDHEEFETGCNLRGFIRIPRIPGHIEFQAGAGDQDLEPTMTNVSHKVRHMSFCTPGEPGEADSCAKLQSVSVPSGHPGRDLMIMPSRMMLIFDSGLHDTANLDGVAFKTDAFHETYEHHLRLVSIVSSSGRAYQFTHYSRIARLNETQIPQARFYYDFEPFAIQVTTESKQWYQFGTSLLAILGGVFVMMRLCAMASITMANALGGKGNGLLT